VLIYRNFTIHNLGECAPHALLRRRYGVKLLNYNKSRARRIARDRCEFLSCDAAKPRATASRIRFLKRDRLSVAGIMKREAEAGAMTGSGGPTSPHKRHRQGDDELRLLIPSKVSDRSIAMCIS